MFADGQPHFAAHNECFGGKGVNVGADDSERRPVARQYFIKALRFQVGFELLKIVVHRALRNVFPGPTFYNLTMLKHICVFCGSSSGVHSVYAQAAQGVGRLLCRRGIELVYGGGNVGLMGMLADACLAEGGRVIGVIPQALVDKEVAHLGLTELRVVRSMHERKAIMADLSDAFVALPGGYGTWEELFEMLTWSQLGIQQKPCGLLNVNGYYNPLLELADKAVSEGFLREVNRDLLLSDDDSERLLDRLSAYG